MNMFVEGIQGMGKTTLLQKLGKKHPAFQIYQEGDYCPIELAWCTYMSKEEYAGAIRQYPSLEAEIRQWTTREEDKYIVAYTRIITDEPGFHKYMEQFEIYNGRNTAGDFQDIVLGRYRRFSGNGNLFECAFFQNIIEELILFQQLSDEEICHFYKRLFHEVKKKDFRLYYLYGEDIKESILRIKEERSDENGNQIWFRLMMEYLRKSPYGIRNRIQDLEGMIAHFRHRQELEMQIIREILGDSAVILPAKKYGETELL